MAASATVSHGSSRLRRCIIAIEGVVQGIGFRPAVYRLAVRHGLGGSVRNSLQGVLVDVEGDATVIASFVAELDALAPGNRRRASITWQEPRGRASAFTVDASLRSGTAELSPTPDRATCEDCLAELMRPGDHRHGYALLTCSVCGPRFTIVRALPYDRERTTMAGFALCRRKRREAKPLAVMVTDLAAARALCRIADAEARLLSSPARPVVLLARRADAAIAVEVAPGCRDLGLMLPYTPLHHLLLQAVGAPLVMTSGNATDDTIAHVDADAQSRLHGVADLFVVHDRPIEVPCDDSVARVVRDIPRLIRRSRGYVPLAVRLPVAASRPILACGGELKNTFALVRGREAFVSQHLGDLTNERAFRTFLDAVGHWRRLLDLSPDVVAHDLHPGYRSTVYARSLDGVERIAVQHHHAHIASCLADNGVDRRVIGVAWDGTGYGLDGRAWGGEFLVADLAGFERAGHFEPVPLPGGDAAAREPWRMAAVFLRAAYGDVMADLDLAFMRRLDRVAWRTLARAIDRGLNAPLTSSAGRLFDAVASLLGVRDRVAFEAQAAMELEALAAPQADVTYATRLDDTGDALVVRTTDVVRGVVDDLLRQTPTAVIAARFHATLADVIVSVCGRIRERTGVGAVALSGGVFQNAWLLAAALDALETAGFEVYSHRDVPANDGGLALGQAAVAARRLSEQDNG